MSSDKTRAERAFNESTPMGGHGDPQKSDDPRTASGEIPPREPRPRVEAAEIAGSTPASGATSDDEAIEVRTYTPAEWVAVAVREDGIYWIDADGTSVVIEVPTGEPARTYGLRGSAAGSITVRCDGDGNAWRGGAGDGDARRHGDGDGDAWRGGAGDGDAWRDGDGDGDAWRHGAGDGDAWRDGDGDGYARRDGDGDGYAQRHGAGIGDAWRRGDGDGDAWRDGDGDGDAWRDGDGDGDARRHGAGDGNAWRDGDGNGNAWRDGDGTGNAWRGGAGDGNAWRGGDGTGYAWRGGAGDGDARRHGAGDGNAQRYGDGDGDAWRGGAGDGDETDSHGTRLTVTADGIPYRCSFGNGWLRIGCEMHPLNHWLAHAAEIDARHDDDIADAVLALARRLAAKEKP